MFHEYPVKLKHILIYLQICKAMELGHQRLFRDLNIKN